MTTKEEATFEPGDAVAWHSAGGVVEGRVVRKLTKPMDVNGHHVAASEEHPEYLVRSDETGAEAAHTPGALTKKE